MAVDSENKRRSAISMPFLAVAPVADGTIDAQDREQATWIYSGITLAAPAVAIGIRKGLLLGVYNQ